MQIDMFHLYGQHLLEMQSHYGRKKKLSMKSNLLSNIKVFWQQLVNLNNAILGFWFILGDFN